MWWSLHYNQTRPNAATVVIQELQTWLTTEKQPGMKNYSHKSKAFSSQYRK